MKGFSLNHGFLRLSSFGVSLNVHSTERSFVWGFKKSQSFGIFKMSRTKEGGYGAGPKKVKGLSKDKNQKLLDTHDSMLITGGKGCGGGRRG